MRTVQIFLIVTLAVTPTVSADEHDQQASAAWTWPSDASVFFGYNDQERRFTDFQAWESQNWFMVAGERPVRREPNHNHLNVDRPRLDSPAARLGWHGRAWQAQVSIARIHDPEPFEPYDVTRLTASIELHSNIQSRPLFMTAAWGENRERHGNLDAYLLEWDWQAFSKGAFYGRAERVAKDILDLGTPAPPGFLDFHRISHVDAVTVGVVWDVARGAFGRLGLGADATVYRISSDLLDSYGAPHSFHVFLRWRPLEPTLTTHVH